MYHLTMKSANGKTGPIPVSTSGAAGRPGGAAAEPVDRGIFPNCRRAYLGTESKMYFGATYSTSPKNFGEITSIFEVDAGWDGYRFHGYCVPTSEELAAAGY